MVGSVLFQCEGQVCVLNGEGHVVLPLDGNVERVDVDILVRCAIVLGVGEVWLGEMVVELVLMRFCLEGVQVEMDCGCLSGLGSCEGILIRAMVLVLMLRVGVERIHGGRSRWRSVAEINNGVGVLARRVTSGSDEGGVCGVTLKRQQ